MKKSRNYSIAKAGWHEIGGKKLYLRSKAELKFAQRLEFLKEYKIIDLWEYEPQVFYFEGIKRGVTNYKPDFMTKDQHGIKYYEVKGYLDPRSITKIKRFIKYYPDLKLVVVYKDHMYEANIFIDKFAEKK